jgi:hypothetical protein
MAIRWEITSVDLVQLSETMRHLRALEVVLIMEEGMAAPHWPNRLTSLQIRLAGEPEQLTAHPRTSGLRQMFTAIGQSVAEIPHLAAFILGRPCRAPVVILSN